MTPILSLGQSCSTLVNTLHHVGERVAADAAVIADPAAGTPEQTLAVFVDLTQLRLQARAAAAVIQTVDELSASLLQARRK